MADDPATRKVMRNGKTPGGFTLLELLLVVSMIAVISAISTPLVTRVAAQYRTRGAADAVAAAIREARAKAVASGWQYRVVGYGASGTIPDSFRVEGRDPSVAGSRWPDQTPSNTRTQTASQYADRWTSLRAEFGGAQFEVAGGSQFIVTFDSRGSIPLSGCLDPCMAGMPGFSVRIILPTGGPARTIQVTQAGGVRVN